MLYNAVSTLGLSKRLQTANTELQLERLRNNDEIASGKHFDVAKALGARTGQAIALRNLYDETDQTLKSTALLQGRLGTMDSALTNILSAGQDVLAAASVGLGQPSPTGSSLQVRARAMLEQVVGMLNASSGNGYLFGGVEVKTAPMRAVQGDESGLPSPIQIVQDAIAAATGGTSSPQTPAETAAAVAALDDLFATPSASPLGFEGGFYQGAPSTAPRLSARLDRTTEIPYGIQGNDPAMRDLLQGLYMLASVDTSQLPLDAYKPYMEAAVAKVSGGIEGVRDATAQLGIHRAQLDDIAAMNTTQLRILNDQLDAMESVDPAEASLRMNQLEVQIEATAAATARIARMSLTNYL
ncbi:flagellar hook protein (plasmid) [Azospirillum baldaniorum]|uniref:Flagellin n=1 Tax=Azospirillum baldaniorum TaxID=1064539 RepID=A0A9P1NRJ4_9PROT|nr:flagellin [Azospirillum baldaniorum]AWJ94761.1 flagellar hook protein [Azospirillum baldaniorum]TWA64270.1 flagellar hook-associated protein 3 FlgL [Azospirillum baldaniorum]TWA73146.1 flagellar hook-associated protein 3 FlgL [Azospirillum brasilense]CCD03177.1 flagellar hook-associated protein 3 [Azospirillum baldaniorum]